MEKQDEKLLDEELLEADIGGGTTAANARCPPDTASGGNPIAPYGLRGPQVEPEAGYWLTPPPEFPRVPTIDEIRKFTEGSDPQYRVDPFPTEIAVLDMEIDELADLAKKRNTDGAIASTEPQRPRKKLSDFIQLRPPPFGAVFNICDEHNACGITPGTPYCDRPQPPIRNVNRQERHRADPNSPPVVKTGRELARMFEIETPGLYHRHALNLLLYNRPDISPPRQARIWMALDVTIYGALCAAWWYKWAAPASISYRQRPYEYDRGNRFRVLYDNIVGDCGRFDSEARDCPCPSPGSPRHPAYPSGHSTYSAAASEILKYFFPDETEHLDRLSDNIGMARLWAGVHWRSDHDAGVKIGNAVARVVQVQLEKDCVAPLPETIQPCNSSAEPLSREVLEQQAENRRKNPCDPNQDRIPPRPEDDDFIKSQGTF